ncbi:hypothetical protein BB934_35360 (plasmid) [Microvirga ossetica]|uniref:Uncharacterized protein n=1 Tax=Microvirga ossetica TaxID=1882682 RepID=A0A1B2EUJ0_9HYPH|nr:hypothetical protein BB934_35360 [Microvirga ossetica]
MSDLVLNGEDVGEVTVVSVSPEMTAISAVDKLRGDAHARADFPDTAFQYKVDPEILAHLLRLHRFALVGEGCVACDNEQAGDLRQVGDKVFGDPVTEILLLGVAAHVVEGQDDDGRLLNAPSLL